jgi:ABC-type transport system involved in Fe-S cluster assembly fused permease/ATPase subunit
MLSAQELKLKTGDLGEKLVAKYFREIGQTVEESLDLFDRKKDMTINEETCEVKTQQRWHMENSFTIAKFQLNKCRSVDRLIFVETPSKYNQDTVTLYEYPKEKRNFRLKNTSDGRSMYLLNVSDGKLLTTYTERYIIDQFNRYSTSNWR